MTAGLCVLVALAAGRAQAQQAQGTKVQLKIESWRNDDLKIWQGMIIPAFEKRYPNISVVYSPTVPTEYNAAVAARLKAGTAGDIIACRPFDASLTLYKAKYLAPLNSLPALKNFGLTAKAAWTTDDSRVTYCVPTASVIHGFLYNKDLFDKLGLMEPKTEQGFLYMLSRVKAESDAVPLVMGTKDRWEAATMGYQNIGPVLWGGETGRKGLLIGRAQYNKGGFLRAFEALSRWQPFLGQDPQSRTYTDAQTLFAQGRGAIYPAGSWDIAAFRTMNPKLKLGAFPPYVFSPSQKCVVNDHPDIGLGLNAASKNQAAARTFLNWTASAEFAGLHANALPGFYPLSNAGTYTLKDPIAQEFLSWRETCNTTFRSSYQLLSRHAEPNNESDLWNVSSQLLNGKMTPRQAADFVQRKLASWYAPQKGK